MPILRGLLAIVLGAPLLSAQIAPVEDVRTLGRFSDGPVLPVAAGAAPQFRSSVSAPLTRADVPWSWRPGCPVAPRRLRAVTLTYWGFDGRVHAGTLVVRRSAVPAVRTSFARAFDARFRIRRMVPVDVYYRGGRVGPARSDTLSMNADNTSAFNCRPKTGRSSYSEHAYGLAVDVNPFENPAKAGARIYPAAGDALLPPPRGAPIGLRRHHGPQRSVPRHAGGGVELGRGVVGSA